MAIEVTPREIQTTNVPEVLSPLYRNVPEPTPVAVATPLPAPETEAPAVIDSVEMQDYNNEYQRLQLESDDALDGVEEPTQDSYLDEYDAYESAIKPRRSKNFLAEKAFKQMGGSTHPLALMDKTTLAMQVSEGMSRAPATDEGSGYAASAVAGVTIDIAQDLANTAVDMAELFDKNGVGSHLDYASMQATFADDLFPRSSNFGPNLVRDLVSWVIPYTAAAKATKGILTATKAQKYAKAASLGAVVDFTVTDRNGDTILGMMSKNYPAQFGWIPTALAAGESDSAIEKRLKATLEGAALGIAADVIFQVGKFAVKQTRARLKKEVDSMAEQAISEGELPAEAKYPEGVIQPKPIDITAGEVPPAEIPAFDDLADMPTQEIPLEQTPEQIASVLDDVSDTLIPAATPAEVTPLVEEVMGSIDAGDIDMDLSELDEIIKRTFGDEAIPSKIGSTTTPPRVMDDAASMQAGRIGNIAFEKLDRMPQPVTMEEVFTKAKETTIQELRSLPLGTPIDATKLAAVTMYKESAQNVAVQNASAYLGNKTAINASKFLDSFTELMHAQALHQLAANDAGVSLAVQKAAIAAAKLQPTAGFMDKIMAQHLDGTINNKNLQDIAETLLKDNDIIPDAKGKGKKRVTKEKAEQIAKETIDQGDEDVKKLREAADKAKKKKKEKVIKTFSDKLQDKIKKAKEVKDTDETLKERIVKAVSKGIENKQLKDAFDAMVADGSIVIPIKPIAIQVKTDAGITHGAAKGLNTISIDLTDTGMYVQKEAIGLQQKMLQAIGKGKKTSPKPEVSYNDAGGVGALADSITEQLDKAVSDGSISKLDFKSFTRVLAEKGVKLSKQALADVEKEAKDALKKEIDEAKKVAKEMAAAEKANPTVAVDGKIVELADKIKKASRMKAKQIRKSKEISIDELGNEIKLTKPKNLDEIAKVGNVSPKSIAHAMWMNGLVSATMANNIFGNMVSIAVHTGDVAFGRAISKVTGSGAVEEGELAAVFSGIFDSFGQHCLNAAKTFKTGKSQFKAVKMYATEFSNPESPFLVKGLDFLVSGAMTKGLRVPDEFFASMAYSMQWNADLVRNAHKLGLTKEKNELFRKAMSEAIDVSKDAYYKEHFGVGFNTMENMKYNKHDGMVIRASDMSNQLTFTNELQGVRGQLAGIIKKTPIVRTVAPFVTTGMNLQKIALAHSPFEAIWNDAIRLNSKDPAARDMGLAKIAFGTAVVGTIATMFETTGRKPTDPKSLSVWNAQGKPEYSVKIGDKWVSMRSLGGFEVLFKMTADFKEIYGELQDSPADLFHADGMIGAMAATAVSSMTPHFMQVGLGDLLEAVNNNDASVIEAWPTTLMAQTTVPWSSLTKQVATQVSGDTDVHAVKGDSTGLYGMWEQYTNKVRGMVGATSGLTHVRNVFGEVVQRPAATGTGLINPFVTSDVDNSAIAREITRLFPEYSTLKRPQGELAPLDADAGIDRVSRSIKIGEVLGNGISIKLDSKEWDTLQAYTGNIDTSEEANRRYINAMNSVMGKEIKEFQAGDRNKRVTLRDALNLLVSTKLYTTAGDTKVTKDATDAQKLTMKKTIQRAYIQRLIQASQKFGREEFIREHTEQLRERMETKRDQIKSLLGVK